MNEKIYMDMMEAADCLETLGKLSQVFFSEVKPRPGLSDDRMGSTLAYLMKLLGERLNTDLAELYEQPTSDNPPLPSCPCVLIEKSPRTEAFFIVADAIKDGLIRPAEVMDYVRKFFPKGEDGTFHKGMFFVGFILATFRRDYEKRTPTESALSERLYKERYNRAGEFLKYARRSINGYCPWAHVDTAMRLEEAINGPATIKPLKLRKPEDEQTIINALIEELVRPAPCALECFKQYTPREAM